MHAVIARIAGQVVAASKEDPRYVVRSDASGKETMSFINEVIELSQATLDASLFEIPADYREVKNSTELYASMSQTGSQSDYGSTNGSTNSNPSNSAMSQTVSPRRMLPRPS